MATGLPPGSYINPAFQHPLTANSTTGYPQRDAAGHKRKLDALRGTQPQENRLKPPTAPSIPRFGSTFPSPGSTRYNPGTSTSHAKKPTNVLGLTPQDGQLQYSSDSEPEETGIDEETMFAELGSNLTFEHNGAVLSLKTAADLAAWKDERARNFPTKARMAAKLEQKRQLGEERLRLLTEASEALRSNGPQRNHARRGPITNSDSVSEVKGPQVQKQGDHDGISKMELVPSNSAPVVSTSYERDSSQLLDKASVSGSVLQVDDKSFAEPNDDLDPVEKPAVEEHVHSKKEIEHSGKPLVLSDALSSVSAVSSSEASDDGRPPEETTSKVEIGFKSVPCRYFLASGYCRDGKSCRYKHELPAGHGPRPTKPTTQQQEQHRYRSQLDSSVSARKTIHDRLLEQEQSKEEELALQVIKYLGKVGLFAKRQ